MEEEDVALGVCNEALLELGQKVRVQKLSGEGLSPNEQVCAAKWPVSVRAVLRAQNWNFATRSMRVGCTRALDGGDGFWFRFKKPVDCVALVGVEGWRAFRVEGDWIYVREPVRWVRYVAEVPVGDWPPEIRDVLVKRVAADIAVAVCGNSQLVTLSEQRYAVALGDAKRMDASEGRDFDFEGKDPISAAMEGAAPGFDGAGWRDAMEGRTV